MSHDAPTTTMHWSRRWVAAVAGAMAVLVCAGTVWALWEPLLVEWHARRLASEDEADQLYAVTALVEIGSPAAVDAVVDWLKDRRERLQRNWERTLLFRGTREAADADRGVLVDDEVACACVSYLADHGSNHLSLLLSRIDETLASDMTAILFKRSRLSEKVLPSLLGCLNDRDARVRCFAVQACVGPAGAYRLPSKETISAVEVCLDDPDAEVRREAKKALERIRGER